MSLGKTDELPASSVESYWQFIASEKANIVFLKDVATGRSTTLSWIVP